VKSTEGPARPVVSPCLLVESVEDELRFLQAVFGVRVREGPSGNTTIWQVEAQLGETALRLGRTSPEAGASTSVLYVWIEDVDGAFARAIAAGASLISEPTDQAWGGREAGFRDPQGNIWWVAQKSGRLSSREVEERLATQRRSRM
jgi:PhnB protein